MRVNRPSWTLRRPCPVCDQGQALLLVACPECEALALVCLEEGAVFAGVTDTDAAPPDATCGECGRHAIEEFEDATDEQIQRAGLTAADYE